ncbi:MAG: acyltransferase, partial [Ilumatobacteraceae bacterium]
MAKTWPPPTAPRKAPISRIPYLPGLDGLRALAVVAVMLYHAGVSWMPGGFLGVEVFFVISGYLITLLLIGEQERRGRISLRGFWARRGRRLLPALIGLLVAVATLSAVLPYLRESLAKL